MGARRALLIHNSRFVDPSLHPLPAADADVERLRDLLIAPHVGFAPEDVTLLSNPSLTDFRTAVSRFFREAQGDDYLFFYYAGHGIRSETGDLYLALRNTRIEDFEAMSLEASFIRRCLLQCLSDQKIVVLDCCNAGAFRQSGHMVARDASYDPGLLVANFDPKGSGTYVLGASQSGASAYETVGADGQPFSLFTDAFIRGVESGEAAPGQPVITLIDISTYVYAKRNAQGQATRPYIDVTNAVGQLEFARNPAFAGVASAAPVMPTEPVPLSARSVSAPGSRRRGLHLVVAGLVVAVFGAGAALIADRTLREPAPDTIVQPKPVSPEPAPTSEAPPVQAIVSVPIALDPPSETASAGSFDVVEATVASLTAPTALNSPSETTVPVLVVPTGPGHATLCAGAPSIDLDLADPELWQSGDTGPSLTRVTSVPERWDISQSWWSVASNGRPEGLDNLDLKIPFCSCDTVDARAGIDWFRADNGFVLSLDNDRTAVNYGSGVEADLHSARSSPYSVRLLARKSGDRALSLNIDRKRNDAPLGFAIIGRLTAPSSYAGRCRN
ncbi:caspase family protein [Palleronia caenipelagi]|uniref:Peptidase C14 caspase domain-containing protein n=1 Tax=Palleronia caenipelagi TaxID=2489174 RepID=A0A547PQ30_9RHOB|nr:caspase family protein [Palleronia caenipelagi]TRD16256.1 hypothetical protein FEV53_14495 [Palleronia caenipelagi]